MSGRILQNRRRGFSLMETLIAVVVTGFIFAMMGFLIFFSARNAINIHEQILSQTSASSASERVTTMLRNASEFQLHPDDTSATVSRLFFLVPENDGSTATKAVAYHKELQEVRIYEDADSLSFDGDNNPVGDPDFAFKHVSNFEINWENQYWVRTKLFFEYRGFILMFEDPGNPRYGQFITDIYTQRIFKYGV